MFSSPYFSSYYNPYEQYQDPRYSRYVAQQQLQRQLAQQRALEIERQRQREAATYAQRLRRAQYFPYDDHNDEEGHGMYSPWERAYTEKLRREALERKRIEEIKLELARRQAEQARMEVEARERYLQAQQRLARERSSPPVASTLQSPIPSASERVPSPPAAPEPQLTPSTQSPSPSPEQLEEAATKIQTTFRVYRALRNIAALEHQFQNLTSSFTFPSNIDYQTPEGIVTVTTPASSTLPASILSDTPKLAFTPTNYALHAYTEALSRLLIKLDGVESWGDASVRRNRRGVVSRVEAEASRVEAYWKQAWAVYLQGSADIPSAAQASEAKEEYEIVEEVAHHAVSIDQETAAVEEGSAPEATKGDAQVAEPPVLAEALGAENLSEITAEAIEGSKSPGNVVDGEIPRELPDDLASHKELADAVVPILETLSAAEHTQIQNLLLVAEETGLGVEGLTEPIAAFDVVEERPKSVIESDHLVSSDVVEEETNHQTRQCGLCAEEVFEEVLQDLTEMDEQEEWSNDEFELFTPPSSSLPSPLPLSLKELDIRTGDGEDFVVV